MKIDFFYDFMANFRNTFIGTNNLLSFRAKLIVCLIVVVKEEKPQLEVLVKKIAKDIYKDNYRSNLFLAIIRNYLKAAKQDELGVDKILKDIKKSTKKNPRFLRTINFVQLNKLVLKKNLNEENEEIEFYSQIRVLEFLKNEVIKYNKLQ